MRKYIKTTDILLVLISLFYLWGCSSGTDNRPVTDSMTVKTSIAISDAEDNPAVVESTGTIRLEFSKPLNTNTVNGSIELYRVKASGDLEIVPCRTESTENQVLLIKADGRKFKEGEEYKLLVKKGILSTDGLTLASDFTGFFATNHSFSLDNTPLTGLTDSRAAIVCISDLHMGDDRSFTLRYGWLRNNRSLLTGFLNKIRLSPNVKELVIAGDLFDEWVAPMDVEPLNGMTLSGFVDSIAASNQDIIDAFNKIIQDGLIKVTYVPGNHDMLVTSEDIARIFPGISQARDARGLGTYAPRQEIIIEHGHRYDFYNAPDPYSNRDIAGTDSLLPPGFFVSKIAATSDMEKIGSSIKTAAATLDTANQSQHNYFLYWVAWEAILSQRPVKESWNAKIIKTGIDGYSSLYAINDLIPYDSGCGKLDVNLYKGIQDTWDERQQTNLVPAPIPAAEAIAAGALDIILDAQALQQYILIPSSNKRIVVFGHTHQTILVPYPAYKAVYVNTGTWIDSVKPPATFAVIIPPQNDSATGHITTYQYLIDGNLKKLDEAVITY
ncbi:MAG: metallophosphoesterase [Deltaproteobacteria bacterium]